MKKILLGTSLLFVCVLTTSVAYAASGTTADATTNLTYTPLEPLPGLENPGSVTLPNLLNAVFKILLSIGALVAVVMLALSGIEYMVSAVPGVKHKARERAQAAVIGILILAASYLILFTINPNLTKFCLFDANGGTCATGGPRPTTSSPVTPTPTTKTDRTVHSFTPTDVQWTDIAKAVCGTSGPCPRYINSTITASNPTYDPSDVIGAFTTNCSVSRYDRIRNQDVRGVVKTYAGSLVGEAGRIGFVCILQ